MIKLGEVAVRTEEDNSVFLWKMQWLTRSGFCKENAELIALSKVDFHFAIRTLEHAKQKGYDEQFVVNLIL